MLHRFTDLEDDENDSSDLIISCKYSGIDDIYKITKHNEYSITNAILHINIHVRI